MVRVSYPTGESILVPAGTSVLSASRQAGVPHAAVCGGQGRCSTCRVRILKGIEGQPCPDKSEKATLHSLTRPDQSIRLGCCLKVHSDIEVQPLLPASTDDFSPEVSGRLLPLTVMFIDIRGYSRMAARMHPFDVVFLLNRYFDMTGTAITEAGGQVDKFIGDGVMALFGIGQDQQVGARQALHAARDIALALQALNRELAAELSEPLRIGIGLHCGEAIVGRFGWGEVPNVSTTAIGDVVNVASRLESATKQFGCQLAMSEQVAMALGAGRYLYPLSDAELPNYVGSVAVRAVEDAASLPL